MARIRNRWLRQIVSLLITTIVLLAASSASASGDHSHRQQAPRLSAVSPSLGGDTVPLAPSRISVTAEPALEEVGQRLQARAAGALARIYEDLQGLPTPPTIEIRVADDIRDMERLAPPGRGVPLWAVGVAYPDLGILIVALRRNGVPLDVEGTLDHELAHLALGAAIGDAPRWLHEGFAYQHSTDWSWERAQTLASMAWWDNITELGDLERHFPNAELPANRAYAQSYDFVGFLAKRGRWIDHYDDGDRWPFRRMLAALAAGEELESAALAAYGSSLSELFDEWRIDLRQRFFMLPAGLFGFLLWLVSALLLVLAWRRRQRQNRARLRRWALDELDRKDEQAQEHEERATESHALSVVGRFMSPAGESQSRSQ